MVYDPNRNDMFTASRGVGAFLNDRRIRVSKRINMNECLIATGFPVVDQSMLDTHLAILKDVIGKTAGARREGSAALDLCNVACGRVDGFFEFNLKPWDIAAGSLIVQEAGGIVTKEAPIDVSNVALFNSATGKADRVGFRIEDGKKVRFFKSTGELVK